MLLLMLALFFAESQLNLLQTFLDGVTRRFSPHVDGSVVWMCSRPLLIVLCTTPAHLFLVSDLYSRRTSFANPWQYIVALALAFIL